MKKKVRYLTLPTFVEENTNSTGKNCHKLLHLSTGGLLVLLRQTVKAGIVKKLPVSYHFEHYDQSQITFSFRDFIPGKRAALVLRFFVNLLPRFDLINVHGWMR